MKVVFYIIKREEKLNCAVQGRKMLSGNSLALEIAFSKWIFFM